ncbi:hypothetical protein BKA69DRAFT_1049948 [Paraphysoderma sedebokerense]|nr:hypothetical protein BKA69DRAFT_1049948 [Paraphysoderma sedebokerense]
MSSFKCASTRLETKFQLHFIKQIKLFVAGTNALCGARCFDTVTKATQNMESKCNKTNSPDENVMWFFKHALFGGKLLCQKDGDQLCVNNAVQQARGLNLLTDVLPLVMPLITSINTDTLATIPQRNAHELFDIAATYMDSVMTKLPAELVCGSCQKSMGIQAYSYFNNIYKPHVVEKLKQPDPSATVNAMWQKAVKKCLTPSPKAAKSVPASGGK